MVLAVECNGIKKSFVERNKRIDAVRGISFAVPKGEIFGILGPNGSGKSTLIRLLATLLLPDAGAVKVFGHDVVKDRYQVRQYISRVSVDAAFFKKLSAMENLLYAGRLYGIPASRVRQQVVEILARLGLSRDKLYTPLEDLSRGQQQKVAIARALLTSPVVILLDEPTTGLDPKSKRDVQDYILEIRAKHDATIILTSHDMQEAERLCDRVAIIEDGRFVAVDTVAGLKQAVGAAATLEDVFLTMTGKGFKEEATE